MDEAWFALGFQFAALVANVDLHHIGGAFELYAPDPVQHDLTGEYLARAPQQEGQQLVLGGRQFNLSDSFCNIAAFLFVYAPNTKTVPASIP
jgi:hypothetical protein